MVVYFSFYWAELVHIGYMDGNEVSQLYVSVPSLPNTRTPIVSLQGFLKNFIKSGDSKRLSFSLTFDQFSTVAKSGVRRVYTGTYTLYVGGHQPIDRKGEQVGNVVSTRFEVED